MLDTPSLKSKPWLNTLFMPTTLAMAMFMVGCSDKPTETAETQPTDDTALSTEENTSTSKEPSASSALAEVQEITINNGAEPESLDPYKVSGVPEFNILRQMFVGLVSTSPDGKIIPGMAESWETPDNKVWTFKLRDAKWSNGDPLTANDFVYSMRRVLDPNTASSYGSFLGDLQVEGAQAINAGEAPVDTLGVKAIDDKTLEITLSKPVPYFPDALIHGSTFPVHQATVEKFGDKWTDPENIVVNGAYKLSEWKVNDKIVLTRNENYFDNDNTIIDKVTLLPIVESKTAVQRFKAGEIDITSDIPTELFDSLKNDLGDQVKITPSLCTYYYEFNTKKPPFDDVRVRRALSMALDRNVITDSILRQGQKPAYKFTPTSADGAGSFVPEWTKWDAEKRATEAKKLLTEAGYSESNPLEFELLYNTSENHKKIAVAATSLFKKNLGMINITLNNKEWKTYLETRNRGDYEMARAGWCSDYNEPSGFLNILKTGNSNNNSGYSSPVFDDLMSQTLQAGVTPEQRADIYSKAEAQLDKDMPLINVYYYVNTKMVKPYINGFSVSDPLDKYQVKDMSIAEH